MKYPKLIRNANTPITVVIYGENINEDGTQNLLVDKHLKCVYQDRAKRIRVKDGTYVEITGVALLDGDIAPNCPVISNGTAEIFGAKREIVAGAKNRNLDGSVNYTSLELK